MPDIFTDTPNQSNTSPNLIKHAIGMFATFIRNPADVTFTEQRPDEDILLFVRKDFVTNVPWMFLTALFLLIPFFLPAVLGLENISVHFIPQRFLFIIIAFYYLIVFGYAFANYITWFYGIGLVTTRRAVDIDLYNTSYISVATAGLDSLKDVRYIQRGFFQSFFDYGNVTMAVEASGETLTFEQVPQPAAVVNLISARIGGN